VSLDKISKSGDIVINSDKALGNGVTDTIQDIVYVVPEHFDPSKTVKIAEQVGKMNALLAESFSEYILIGPGRWGTQDRHLGVPVKWSQVSGVKIMVETALENFNIEPSQGTHFFQNIVSRGIGYIYVSLGSKKNFVDWTWIQKQNVQKEFKFVRHVHLTSPITVRIDGRCGHAMVTR